MPERNLTDADVEALANALKDKIVHEFYRDLGQGVWSWVVKIVFAAMIGLASYGAMKGSQ